MLLWRRSPYWYLFDDDGIPTVSTTSLQKPYGRADRRNRQLCTRFGGLE